MVLPWLTIRDLVITQLSKQVYNQLISVIQHSNLTLWGEQQPRGFHEKVTATILYKYLTDTGFNSIVDTTRQWLHQSNNSITHNAHLILPVLQVWAEEQIKLGEAADWNQAARDVPRPPPLQDVNLWIDSSDFPKRKVKGAGTTSSYWSYKLNRPGRRYMVLRDGRRRIRRVWGGYSPKIHDSSFLDCKKRTLKRKLRGGVVVGDGHFTKAGELFRDPKFHTPIRHPRGSKSPRPGTSIRTLTIAQQHYNNAVCTLRARMEQPFGTIKSTWKCLKTPWADSDEMLDAVVITAAGCYNAKLS